MSDTEERKQVIMEFLQRPLLSVFDYAVDEIVRLRAIESAVRRVMAAQERMGQGSWFPSAKDIEECDAAWDDLRTALDTRNDTLTIR